MKVLIVENEVYLAQSIASRLEALEYECEVAVSPNSATGVSGDVGIVLLSTSIDEALIYAIIERYKNAVIILLASYISINTVANPIKAGASDFIQKPFMIEELVRKIKHYEEFNKFKQLTNTYQAYIENYLATKFPRKFELEKLVFPLFIKYQNEQYANGYVFMLCKSANLAYKYERCDESFDLDEFESKIGNDVMYLSNFGILDSDSKRRVLEIAKFKRLIIATANQADECKFHTIELEYEDDGLLNGEQILTAVDYINQVIIKYQNMYPDTELARMLGISRKSVWEKRRKYGITKAK